MKNKGRMLFVKDLLTDQRIWGDKRKVYITSIIVGLIIGKLIRVFVCKKGF